MSSLNYQQKLIKQLLNFPNMRKIAKPILYIFSQFSYIELINMRSKTKKKSWKNACQEYEKTKLYQKINLYGKTKARVGKNVSWYIWKHWNRRENNNKYISLFVPIWLHQEVKILFNMKFNIMTMTVLQHENIKNSRQWGGFFIIIILEYLLIIFVNI